MKRKRRALFMSDDIWERLVVYAEKHGMSVSEVIRRAIAEFLTKVEG